MRKIALILCVVALFTPLAAQAALADGMVLPEILGNWTFAVRYHHVTVDITDNHAVTVVDQEFYNPFDQPVHGLYLFPVPPQAFLTDFKATVDGLVQRVDRQDVATTNAVLYESVRNQTDPSLFQYADWESLAFSFDLPALGTRRMVLEYEEVLTPQSGLYHYRYVLSTEQYSALPVENVSVTVNLTSSAGLGSLYTSSHDVITHRTGPGQATVTWSTEYALPNADFDLFFSPADGGFGGGLALGQRADRDHFLFLFAPDLQQNQEDVLPKDIVFVLDRSGSMTGEKIAQARSALQFILGQLNPDDRFSIVGFDDQMDVFSPTLQPVTSGALSEARSFVDRLEARNNTDLERALQTGLAILERSELRPQASRQVVFLTDGLPTAGYTDAETIARLVEQTNDRLDARLHVFGVGYDVNTHLLDRLAADNYGSVTYVPPGQNIETVLVTFYEKIAAPLLTDVVVEFDGIQVSDLHPQQIPDMYQGSSIILTGRYTGAEPTISVRVRGRSGDQPIEFTYTYDRDQVRSYDFVPRLWATRQIGYLLDVVRTEGETAALVDEIRALGLSYGLVTPYTTYLITPQQSGVASAENMYLYDTTNQQALNQVSGQVTVQARMQNQGYQQADKAGLASGSNVINAGKNTVVQIGVQYYDVTLLPAPDQAQMTANQQVDWQTEPQIDIDLQIKFGSDEYFELAKDPDARVFLQTGANVQFNYQGQVIQVMTDDNS